MQKISKLCRLVDINLPFVGIKQVDAVLHIHSDRLNLAAKTDAQTTIIAAAEHKEQLTLGIVLVNIPVA